MQNVAKHRTLPFHRRPDVAVQTHYARGIQFCVVKDPLSLKYWKLDPAQYRVFCLLDGTTSVDDIRQRLQAEFPVWHITLQDVLQLVIDLQKKGLLVASRAHQCASLLAKGRDDFVKQVLQTVQNPLFIRFPGLDLDRFLGALNRSIGWIFHPLSIVLCALVILASWGLIYVRREEVWQQLPSFQQFFAWPNVMYLWAVVGFTKIIHELGHGVATKRIGRACHTIGAALLVLSPTMYCDATDSWMARSKWKRMGVAAAGMFVEVLLASIAFLLWSVTLPGVLKHILLNIFFVSAVATVIFNANPLIRFDGYYILSDWLEIPNLGEESTDLLQRGLGWCFGLEIEKRSTTVGPLWILATYGIAAFLYRWFLLLTISFGIYLVFKSYGVPSVGASLAVFSIGGWMAGNCRAAHQLWKRHNKGEKIRRGRCRVTVLVLLALLSATFWIRIPVSRSAPMYAEPDGVRHVYAKVSGNLREVSIQEGQPVEVGENIASLVSHELVDRLRDLEVRLRATSKEKDAAESLSDHAVVVAKEQEIARLVALIAEAHQELRHVAVSSPIAGQIIWPERTPAPSIEKRKTSLGGWNAVPLLSRNSHSFVTAGTHLCSIAPDPATFVAKILVDQEDRNDIQVGSVVRLKFDSHPLRVVQAEVVAVSDQQSEVIPRLMSLSGGGKMATVTDSMGYERLDSNAYLVTARWTAPQELRLHTSARGEARFWVNNRTLYQWVYQWCCSTFRFHV